MKLNIFKKWGWSQKAEKLSRLKTAISSYTSEGPPLTDRDLPSYEESAKLSFEEGYRLLKDRYDDAAERCFAFGVMMLEKWRSSSDRSYSSYRFTEIAISHAVRLVNLRRFEPALLALETALEELDFHAQSGTSVGVVQLRAKCLGLLALCYRMLQNFDEASSLYLRAIASWKIVACFARAEEDRTRAIRSLAATMYNFARSLKMQGERSEARAYLEEAQALYESLVKI